MIFTETNAQRVSAMELRKYYRLTRMYPKIKGTIYWVETNALWDYTTTDYYYRLHDTYPAVP